MTTVTIDSERIDDVPLLMHWMLEMHIDRIIDAAIGAPHGNRQGLSYGQLAVVYLAYILSQCRHFLSPVREWVAKHQQGLTQALGQPIGETDFTDDRLEDLLDAVGQEDVGEEIEKQLGQHLIRAYALPTATARIDTTTVNVYHRPEKESILDYGVSKDHRPDLRQFKEVLSTLDPAGIPLCSAMVAGHCADDPLYLPLWQRLVEVLGRTDFLVVGDCKLTSLANRAQIQAGGGYYLAPLAMTGDAPEQLRRWVLQPPVKPVDLYLPGVEERIGQGFEVVVAQSWTPPKTESHVIWHERVFVMSSDKLGRRHQQGLAARLQRTERALRKLKTGAATELAQLTVQSQALLTHNDVGAYLDVTWTPHTNQTKHYLKRGRHGPNSPSEIVETITWQLQITHNDDAIETFNQLAGWRLYVTNAPVARLDLNGALACYREEWQPERGFHRLKGAALAIRPLLLRSDQRIAGLMRLLVLALRVLTLLEFVARRQLSQQGEPLRGLYAGKPKRAAPNPTAERLLQAFADLTLYSVTDDQQTTYQVTPLSALQRRILGLLGIPETVYTALAQLPLASSP
ncbi:MAG: IS1634 family transposase [Anaerolineales bacterium]|nr:IS1634 family transposase [Anaerolineales bacterium]